MQKNMHARRVRSLIVISVITAVILSVSTYAWFIGMKSIAVSAFEVTIKVTESLKLSFDGETWEDQEITLDMDKIKKQGVEGYYTNDTNKWSQLIPLSTVGEMDTNSSRMKLFEKTSYTPTEGGYRLISKQVVNDGATEGNGYLVFDLFIRNYTGEHYDPVLDPNAEEAIFLAADSKAETTQVGGGVEGTGIENSIRVAFAQIGRVKGAKVDEAGYDPSLVTGITCATAGDVTGICRTAQIWEPNDTEHVDAAKNYYLTSCLKRGLKNEVLVYGPEDDPEDNKCNDILQGTAYRTYAVKTEIGVDDKIDVYDGEDYNGYSGNSYEAITNESGKLMAYPYFTDTAKAKTKAERPQFMTLAPNSVTKVRVYIYIEGQDIDAANFSEIGKKIAINFGFTKERYNENEIITP